ncbi:NAD-dependent epimerase/dehydratase [Dillenia turbinata]|uniref:NAD-dependent epimerase/dehydratase n=1 Tax=Dillenia turbinata TaxID=194707 RepID=A0AAN8Z8J9_9MAGN
MSGEGKVVAVTGASGYIASWLVKLLLEQGYTVRASVRDPYARKPMLNVIISLFYVMHTTADPRKTEHLVGLDGARERLKLFKANLLEEGSFDALVEGCDGVFHTASPVLLSAHAQPEELIEPAVKGTLNVLGSCAKAPSLKRVVITSSLASVVCNGKPLTSDTVVDETWYSDPVYCEENKLHYPLSKTLAEKVAWDFAKEHNIDLVTLHPVVVIGPPLQPILNLSVEFVLNLLNGKTAISEPNYRFVDVRDVALAHVKAFEILSANGRYILDGMVPNYELFKILHPLSPGLVTLEEKCKDDKPFASAYNVSQEKAKSLGISYTPVEVSLKDTFESLREKKFISF